MSAGKTSIIAIRTKHIVPFFFLQMTSFSHNPFTWDTSANMIKSSVVDFTMKSGGQKLAISGLKVPIHLYIPLPGDGTSPVNSSANSTDFLFVKDSKEGSNMRYHKIDIPSYDMAVSLRIETERNHPIFIFIGYNSRPTTENYTFSSVVPDYSHCPDISDTEKEQGIFANCSRDPFVVLLTSTLTGQTGMHYLGIKYNRTEGLNRSAGTSPGGITRKSCGPSSVRSKRSCVYVKDPPTAAPSTPTFIVREYNPETDLKYWMSITVSGCLYWSEPKEKWTGEGCKVGDCSSAYFHTL